jgi:hypothetical protein
MNLKIHHPTVKWVNGACFSHPKSNGTSSLMQLPELNRSFKPSEIFIPNTVNATKEEIEKTFMGYIGYSKWASNIQE